jgi:hypothetical protein
MDNHEFNGFIYKSNENDPKLPFIQIDGKKDKPVFVTKYYPLNENSINALINRYFYASHPFELNDYLDASSFLLHATRPLDFKFYKNLFGNRLNEEKLLQLYNEDNTEKQSCRSYITLFWETISNIFGIISLSGSENNNLMWPHYAQESGFQLKFNTEELEESIKNKIGKNEVFGLFPVNYTDKLVPIDLSKFNQHYIPFFYLTNIKLKSWNYENEWRFIIGKNYMGVPYSKSPFELMPDFYVDIKNRFAYYDSNIVKEITLGHNYINRTRFHINRVSEKITILEPIPNIENNINIILLDFISENLKDKLFYSGVTYHKSDDDVSVIRTKERMEIIKIENYKYQLTRTHEVIKFP